MKKLDNVEFIMLANKKHNYRYNYSKTIYKNSQDKVIVICENNHEFLVRPDWYFFTSWNNRCRWVPWNRFYLLSDNFITK